MQAAAFFAVAVRIFGLLFKPKISADTAHPDVELVVNNFALKEQIAQLELDLKDSKLTGFRLKLDLSQSNTQINCERAITRVKEFAIRIREQYRTLATIKSAPKNSAMILLAFKIQAGIDDSTVKFLTEVQAARERVWRMYDLGSPWRSTVPDGFFLIEALMQFGEEEFWKMGVSLTFYEAFRGTQLNLRALSCVPAAYMDFVVHLAKIKLDFALLDKIVEVFGEEVCMSLPWELNKRIIQEMRKSFTK
ncbi:hypothetical protein HDU83_009807 [Entophlyctis luteolus]|nr:hypothetical protein HDU83_009807 [Entophlyctis luteolus]